jgi:hypothetical protein
MGSYRHTYNDQTTDNNIIVAWWSQASQPGNNYVNGAQVFSLYDGGSGYTSGVVHGSYPATETYTPGYCAIRIAAQALASCRPTYPITSSINNVLSVVTKDSLGHYLPARVQQRQPWCHRNRRLVSLNRERNGDAVGIQL